MNNLEYYIPLSIVFVASIITNICYLTRRQQSSVKPLIELEEFDVDSKLTVNTGINTDSQSIYLNQTESSVPKWAKEEYIRDTHTC